jgi:hypothetical protein
MMGPRPGGRGRGLIGSFFLRGHRPPHNPAHRAAKRLENAGTGRLSHGRHRGSPDPFRGPAADGTRLQSSMEETLKEKTTLRACWSPFLWASSWWTEGATSSTRTRPWGDSSGSSPARSRGSPWRDPEGAELTGLISKARAGVAGQVDFVLREKEERFIHAQAVPTPYGTVAVLGDLTEKTPHGRGEKRLRGRREPRAADPPHGHPGATELLMD